jgi:hypothetical protein
MKKQLIALVLCAITSSPLFCADTVQELVKLTDDGEIWAFRWSHGNMLMYSSIVMPTRSERGATKRLVDDVLPICRARDMHAYRFAAFHDVEADPTLRAAWEHFGGGAQQSTGARKTAFRLVIMTTTADKVSPPKGWEPCWTKRQVKMKQREEARAAKHKAKLEVMRQKALAKMANDKKN